MGIKDGTEILHGIKFSKLEVKVECIGYMNKEEEGDQYKCGTEIA